MATVPFNYLKKQFDVDLSEFFYDTGNFLYINLNAKVIQESAARSGHTFTYQQAKDCFTKYFLRYAKLTKQAQNIEVGEVSLTGTDIQGVLHDFNPLQCYIKFPLSRQNGPKQAGRFSVKGGAVLSYTLFPDILDITETALTHLNDTFLRYRKDYTGIDRAYFFRVACPVFIQQNNYTVKFKGVQQSKTENYIQYYYDQLIFEYFDGNGLDLSANFESYCLSEYRNRVYEKNYPSAWIDNFANDLTI